MSQAINHRSVPVNSNFGIPLPCLRTLIDMLLVTGGLFHIFAIHSSLFISGTTWQFFAYKVCIWISFAVAGAVAFSAASFKHLKYRQIALFCVAILLLKYAMINSVVWGFFPPSDFTSDVNWLVIGVATWGLVSVGLISIENRLVARLAVTDKTASSFSLCHTALRLAALPSGFMYSLNWIILPIWLINFWIDPNARFEEIQECYGRSPSTLEATALTAISVWFLAVQCGFAVFFWRILNSFHTPGVDPSQVLKARCEGRWAEIYLMFTAIGIAGFIALTITYNATSFGLASAPWILIAMICALIGCWKLKKVQSPDG